jgi:multisubunit Na+/H+ antiporter MnhE subunit
MTPGSKAFYEPNDFYRFMRIQFFSVLRLLTGFAIAALSTCMLTTNVAIARATMQAAAKIHHDILVQ